MAYYKLHAYDADVRIPEFRGLRQDSEIASDLRFAIDVENVETIDGVLQPQAGMTILEGQFSDRVETLARFHRRWYDGPKEWLVCAAGGEIYYRQANDEQGWQKIIRPDSEPFQSNVWSWVTYEQNIVEEEVAKTIDVLLISNAKDGMYMVSPPDRLTTWGDIYNDGNGFTWGQIEEMTWNEVYTEKWTISKVNTTVGDKEYRFGVIERFNERVWGAAIDGEPDLLMYSTLFDPTDWQPYDPEGDDAPDADDPRQEDECPGDIPLPSWDGDSFTALKAFGDQLLAFKGTKVWRVMGVGPGEFTCTQQYGGGTLYPNTIAVDVEKVLLVERDGISYYDGMTVSPFNRPFIEKFWRTVNPGAMDQMCAAMFKHRYYLSVPTNGSAVNNALIVYDSEQGSFLLYRDIYIESLMPANDILYATSSSLPGKIMKINYNSWETGLTSGKGTRWETPWMDFNYKTIAKGGYEIYFNPEVRHYPVTFRFSIRTEKKIKSKMVTIQPTIDKAKQKRIRFGGTSRRFKLIIESLPIANGATWRMAGGIHMVVETDPD